jgi:lipopolysaccharide/colanic/teichoic acid biosynthesis glycosyltransferase
VGVAAAGLLVLSPLMALIAVAIRLTSPGPAIFRQERCGLNGRRFRFYKFRSMCHNAEELKDALAHLSTRETAFKIPDDPRLTGLGRYLRKFSIDEWPQLWNVLRGDMSLVGPRPALPDEAEKYAEHVHRRLVVKPGITGLWQVSGRSDLSWDESVRLDLRYVENWSFALDLQILWKTASVLVRRSGAY